MKFYPVESIEEVLSIAFPNDESKRLSKEEADRILNEYLESEKNKENKNAD